MIVLGIDTSTSYAGVALSVDGETTSTGWHSQHNHGREMMPAVMELLNTANLEASDIDAVAVALGPGGFSAVRVGIATAQGLVGPSQTRLVGVPSHLIQAFPYRGAQGNRVVSLIPIGRKQVSYCVYSVPFDVVVEEDEVGICAIDEVLTLFGSPDTLICGEGAELKDGSDPTVDSLNFRSPNDLLAIALEKLEREEEPLGLIEPIYSRPPTITAPRRV